MTDKEYSTLLERIYEKFPSFQVVGDRAFKPGLDNMKSIDSLLSHPSKDFISVHVAGTNGKGSVSHMLAAALMQLPKNFLKEGAHKSLASLMARVGLYTSPHLVDFRERIKVDGEMVPKEWVYNYLVRHLEMFEAVGASFFEITTAMAFSYFSYRKVDIAVIECGLGGRLDATNILSPMACVITNIGYDHTQYLGSTLVEIAAEKSGIIKPTTPVIVGEVNDIAVRNVFTGRADECSASLYFAEKLTPFTLLPEGVCHSNCDAFDLDSKIPKSVISLATCILASVDISKMDLQGDCQKKNIKTVSMALAVILKRLSIRSLCELSEEMLSDMVMAIENAAKLTGLRGRWEKLSDNPLTICDIGHNGHGMKILMPQVERTFKLRKEHYASATSRLIILFGIMGDKDLSSEIEYLPQEAYYLYVNASTPRALPASELKVRMEAAGFKGEVVSAVAAEVLSEIPADSSMHQKSAKELMAGSIAAGLEWIKRNARPEDFVFIGGSSYVVAEALHFFPK